MNNPLAHPSGSFPERIGVSADYTYDFIRRNPDYRRLVAYIDTGEHGWLDFDMQEEAKVDLFLGGARGAAGFLCAFDWTEYKEVRRREKELYTALLA